MRPASFSTTVGCSPNILVFLTDVVYPRPPPSLSAVAFFDCRKQGQGLGAGWTQN